MTMRGVGGEELNSSIECSYSRRMGKLYYYDDYGVSACKGAYF